MKNNLPLKVLISVFLIQAFLSACIPMNTEQINEKALSLYSEMLKTGPEDLSSEKEKNEKGNNKGLAEDQVLRLSGRSIYSFDPATIYSGDMLLAEQLFPGLTRMESGSTEFMPVLAEKWSVSEDQKTWTFDLKKEIPWVSYDPTTNKVEQIKDESGNPRFVNADEIKSGLLRVLSPTLYSGNAFNLKWINGAEEYTAGYGDVNAVGIEVVGDDQIAFHLWAPNASFDALAELTAFSPFPTWSIFDSNQVLMLDMMTAFYGPYVVKEYVPEKSVTLIKNPFWKGTEGLPVPTLEEIHYDLRSYGEQDVVAAFKAGELDAVELNLDEYQSVKDDPEFKDLLQIEKGSCGYYLLFNNMNLSPLDDVKVRQAISASIDRQALNEAIYQGTGSALLQYSPSFLRGSQDLSKKNEFNFDAGKAKAILNSSKVVNSADVQNQMLTLYTIDSDNYLNLADLISGVYLSENLGLNVSIDKYSWSDYASTIQLTQSPSLYLYGYCLDYADSKNLWDLWLPGSPFSDVSRGIYTNSAFYTLVNNAPTLLDPKERQKQYEQAEEIIINQDTAIVPLVWNSQIWLVKSNINAEILPFYQQFENWQITK